MEVEKKEDQSVGRMAIGFNFIKQGRIFGFLIQLPIANSKC